jgi:hypothetical protein
VGGIDFHGSCLHAEVLAFLHAGMGGQPAMMITQSFV